MEISRRVTLEELPPVLVLHLKRFVFEKTGGCQKLVKNIEYPVDLEISKGKMDTLDVFQFMALQDKFADEFSLCQWC